MDEMIPGVAAADVEIAGVVPEAPVAAEPVEDEFDADSDSQWLGRITRSKRVRKDLIPFWSESVDYRRGKPFGEQSDQERVNVNLDWSLVKNKHAQLFSQMPQVYLKAKSPKYQPVIQFHRKQLNDVLTTANCGATVDEAVFDAINASGFGVALVGYQAMTEIVTLQDGTTAPRTVSFKHSIDRISPSDFLWPDAFERSNWDEADWLGRSGKLLWPDAKRRFKLTDDMKEKVLGEKSKEARNLRQDNDSTDEEMLVEFDEVFYWAHRFTDAKYFKQINHVVFIRGIDKAVIHGPWAGQKLAPKPDGTQGYVGSCIFPIRVLTLTYISDDAIPPSDSAIGRPQINEMIESRTQIVLNRRHSQPVRWVDVNRVDPLVLDTIMRGEYQMFIPVQGDGSRSIGEVARAAYPKEDFAFDDVINGDLSRQWGAGPNQSGNYSEGRHSAEESRNVQAGFSARIGYERSRVAAFITGIAEVVGSNLALFGDYSILDEKMVATMGQTWDAKTIGPEMVYWIRPDATLLLDANQRTQQLLDTLNATGKSGYVNPKNIIAEVLELNDIDLDGTLVDPNPPPPPAPNISLRFSGVDDLTNPLVVAMLIHTGQMPSPEELEAAKKMLAAVDMDQPTPQQPPAPPTTGMDRPPIDGNPEWGNMPTVSKRVEMEPR